MKASWWACARCRAIPTTATRSKRRSSWSAFLLSAPKIVIVDSGYQGSDLGGIRILRSGQKCGISRMLRAMIKRRSAIEPNIGPIKKTDGRLGRNALKGALGDALPGVLCGAGQNIRLLLKKLLPQLTFIHWAITSDRAMNHRAHQLPIDRARSCSGRATYGRKIARKS